MKRNKPLSRPVISPDFSEKFQTYLDKCGALLDEYKVPRELVEKLAELDRKIEADIEEETLDSDRIIKEMEADDNLREGLVYKLGDWASSADWESIIDNLPAKYKVVEIENLAEELVYDKFIAYLDKSRNAGVGSL